MTIGKTAKVFASTRRPLSLRGNQGDLFNYEIFSKLRGNDFARLGVDDHGLIDDSTFCFVGSVLQSLPSKRGMILYGPGFIASGCNPASLVGNQCYGVRGFYSEEICRKRYNKSFPIVSDPGLLLSHVVSDLEVSPGEQYEIGFIIHSVDRMDFFDKNPTFKPFLVDNYSDLSELYRKLKSCKRIATSSLHGAIFSHSLGIKCGVFRQGGSIIGGEFKYLDYYSSLGLDIAIPKYDIIGNTLADFCDFVDNFPQPSFSHVQNLKEKMLFDINMLIEEFSRSSSCY